MRAIVFLFLTTAGGGTPLLAETLHSSSGPPQPVMAAETRLPTPERIAEELKCSVVFTLDAPEIAIKRAEEFGRHFANFWASLPARGFDFPSATERAHFYAQILFESKNLRWQSELDPSKSKIKNAELWRGRGPIQLSHCKNYAAFAYFLKNYEQGKRGTRLFNEPPDLHTHPCPPPSVEGSLIVIDPELAMGNNPMGGHRIAAVSAVWWWGARKVRSKKFRTSIENGNDGSVETVTKFVKGSTETANQRRENFKVAKQCIEKVQRNRK